MRESRDTGAGLPVVLGGFALGIVIGGIVIVGIPLGGPALGGIVLGGIDLVWIALGDTVLGDTVLGDGTLVTAAPALWEPASRLPLEAALGFAVVTLRMPRAFAPALARLALDLNSAPRMGRYIDESPGEFHTFRVRNRFRAEALLVQTDTRNLSVRMRSAR